ncbi:hypothetical protein T484DRAFT_1795015 [Baffinella frigidus]|nr:hypothetical protein T484DRAFT_1795015 [Cryptophyta sp. CCMP2293]
MAGARSKMATTLLMLSTLASSLAFTVPARPLSLLPALRPFPQAGLGAPDRCTRLTPGPAWRESGSGKRCGGVAMMARARGVGKDDGTRYDTIGSGLRRPEQWRKEGGAAKRDGAVPIAPVIAIAKNTGRVLILLFTAAWLAQIFRAASLTIRLAASTGVAGTASAFSSLLAASAAATPLPSALAMLLSPLVALGTMAWTVARVVCYTVTAAGADMAWMLAGTASVVL